MSDSVPEFWLLVHRRSELISEPLTLSAPGGRVLRGQEPFEERARKTALSELREESGLKLDIEHLVLMSHPSRSHSERHLNFSVVLSEFPHIPGPVADHRFEVKHKGAQDIQGAKQAGDGFHAWVQVDNLLEQSDLLPACRDVLHVFREERVNACAPDQTSRVAPVAISHAADVSRSLRVDEMHRGLLESEGDRESRSESVSSGSSCRSCSLERKHKHRRKSRSESGSVDSSCRSGSLERERRHRKVERRDGTSPAKEAPSDTETRKLLTPNARPRPPPAKARPGSICAKAMPKRVGARNCLQVPPKSIIAALLQESKQNEY